jgi:hypothetical protein
MDHSRGGILHSFSERFKINLASGPKIGVHFSMDCAGYILGVFDQMSLSRLICPPINADGGSTQAVAIPLKFLNEHPEQWHVAPVFLVGQSFKAAFPCGARRD